MSEVFDNNGHKVHPNTGEQPMSAQIKKKDYKNPSCFGTKLGATVCYTNCPVRDECYKQK